MKERLLHHLICPKTKEELTLEVDKYDGDEIISGTLTSKSGAQSYPIEKGVPRFVPSDAYADSFSRQRIYVRRHFEHYRHDRSGDLRFESSTGFTYDELSNGLTLEVGCGYGRYLDVIDRNSDGEVIGIDLSTHSIELSNDFVGRRKNVHLVQCDLFELPFRQKTFERIYSLGVLHHTPDTKQAFCALPPFVSDSGQVSIWVYPPEMKKIPDFWRVLTTRLPHPVLYRLCIANQFLTGWIRGLPGGWRLGKIIPGATPRDGNNFWQRVLSDFDNLSPTYAYSHSPEEVSEWYRQAGLNDVRVLEMRTAVSGRASR